MPTKKTNNDVFVRIEKETRQALKLLALKAGLTLKAYLKKISKTK